MNSPFSKTTILLLVCISFVSADLMYGAYYNPGLKLGIQFGKKTSFIVGFENSLTLARTYGMPFFGLVGGIAYNFNQKNFLEYWEIEGGFTPLGMAFGGEWNNGYHASIRFFGGALGYISYKHLLRTKRHEISLIGKIPLGFYEVMDHGVYIFGRENHHRD